MFKHRFIVSETDFRIFAAIPTESRLLTWKKWRRPPDWAALRLIFEETAAILGKLAEVWVDVSDGYRVIANLAVPDNLQSARESEREKESRALRKKQSLETRILSEVCGSEADRCRELAALTFEAVDDDASRQWSGEARKFLVRVSGGVSTGSVDDLIESAKNHCDYYENLVLDEKNQFHKNLDALGMREAELVTRSVVAFHDTYSILLTLFKKISVEQRRAADMVGKLEDWSAFKLPADLECPVGVPFAAYTVELGEHVVVDVVEGHAWIEATGDSRQATEAEQRATEIVSQMLVERGQNPKAPTRIAVREVDPKHAHEQRSAEARPGPPKVRTIKFYVTPPRYLREAAEVILASPRKAHWVVGHWRNQPFGEGRTSHRQTWIKPHIRGLGEAGATTVKVVAAPKSKEHA